MEEDLQNAYVTYMGLPIPGIEEYEIRPFLQNPTEGEIRELGFAEMSMTRKHVTYETSNKPYILRVYVKYIKGAEWGVVRINNSDV